jgi:hypothetical protein
LELDELLEEKVSVAIANLIAISDLVKHSGGENPNILGSTFGTRSLQKTSENFLKRMMH